MGKRIIRIGASLAIVALTLNSCNESVCEEIAEISCTRMAECFPDYFTRIYGGSLDACTSEGSGRDCMAWTKLPGVTQTRESIVACFRALEGWGCDDLPPECPDSPGTLPDGASCASLDQCRSGYCAFPDEYDLAARTSSCGYCLTLPESPEPGGACDTGNDCAWDEYCANEICVPKLEDGEACVADEHACASGYARCIEGRCTPVEFVAIGESCGINDRVECAGGYCDLASERCTARGGKGAPCSQPYHCESGLVCYEFECQPPTAETCLE